MLKAQVSHLYHHQSPPPGLLTRQKKNFIAGDEGIEASRRLSSFVSRNTLAFPTKHHTSFLAQRYTRNSVTQIKSNTAESNTVSNAIETIGLKAVITFQLTTGGVLSNLSLTNLLDSIGDLLGKSLFLELVAAEADPKTGFQKPTIQEYAHRSGKKGDDLTYVAEFEVPEDFGSIGAILIENKYHKEMFVKSIVLEGLPIGPISVSCNSWVHSKFDNAKNRVFFLDKVQCLPSHTPSGLKDLREQELAILRGDGVADKPLEKKDRIYDYDVYNDLADTDKDPKSAREVLGTKDFPYPRRCKTGRPHTKSNPLLEPKSSDGYVPRDEVLTEVQNKSFSSKIFRSVLHALLPVLEATMIDKDLGFKYFTSIESLFNEGVNVAPLDDKGFLGNIIPRLLKAFEDARNSILLFDTPETMNRDKFSWLRDQEFCRQTLAGPNPMSIKCVTEWPLKSKLDPEVYGPPESAITKQIIEWQIKGYCTLEEAIEDKKLFMIDYHDVFLPYVNKVRDQENFRTTLYGSRTLMFLMPNGTLRPLAIELVRPPGNGKPQWKQVFTPTWEATGAWLWKLAKVHVLAHDSVYHQLINHLVRAHCCTEPYILATNRQLSKMHPIHSLLHPHFRSTLAMNALARGGLISSGGLFETFFSPGKYSIELSSFAYGLQWRFDHEALPDDLIARGMAVEDPDSPHGLKLAIEDYPYANDGLVLWDAIKDWVVEYVNHYYPEDDLVESDSELQAWWTEIRTVGHAEKKDEPWWPVLKTPKDLIHILTTIIWIASGHHAAVNFGQYDYGAYVPYRGTIARVKMPCEDPTEDEWEAFKRRPEDELLSTFPSQIQASTNMAVLDILSNHPPDEEYIGTTMEPAFEANPKIKAAYEIFAGRLKELEGIIDGRNADENRKNRNGVGVVSYNLLKPFSEPGVTCMGVPNSISI